MSSSTLQFVVAGALIAAWVWMLGRPILTSLFRRSRRDSVGHFRYQQAVLSRPAVHEPRVWWSFADRPRPLADWRAQPIERRRLQMLLGFAIATFLSLLLAIALRGSFIRLFAMMAVCFVAYLGVAIYIGSAQLRRLEAYQRQLAVAAAERRAAASAIERQNLASSILEDDAPGVLAALGADGPLAGAGLRDEGNRRSGFLEDWDAPDDLELFGQGIFDEDFYEPIPELTFQPLNLDASLVQPDGEARPVFPADPQQEDEIDLEVDDTETDHEAETDQEAGDTRPEPTFTAPAPQRTRPPKRPKARPIYIESQLDAEEKQAKAVND